MLLKSLLTYCIKLIIGLSIIVPTTALAGVSGTKHDLRNTPAREICVFCHTPHNSNPELAPLWNRRIVTYAPYTMYQSPTLNAPIKSLPSKISLACLSCHDIAAGGQQPGEAVYTFGGVEYQHRLINDGGDPSPGSCPTCHPGGGYSAKFNIGPDMSNDHPISIAYPNSGQDPNFNIPPDLNRGWSDVKLFEGYIECSTCHDPHDGSKGFFLRKSNDSSSLCFTCHIK